MRKFIINLLFILITLSLVTSCSKDKASYRNLKGTWESYKAIDVVKKEHAASRLTLTLEFSRNKYEGQPIKEDARTVRWI